MATRLETEVGEENEEEESTDYAMDAIPQGQCIIINNIVFLDSKLHPKREGSEIDSEQLQYLFGSYLNFDVKLFENVTRPELHDILKECQRCNHSLYDALVIIILSHGDSGDIIYTIEGSYVTVKEIARYFTSSSCPSLSNKPKVFIIQACRGPLENQAIPHSLEPDQSIIPTDIHTVLPTSTLPTSTLPTSTLPPSYVYTTHESNPAYTIHGSYTNFTHPSNSTLDERPYRTHAECTPSISTIIPSEHTQVNTPTEDTQNILNFPSTLIPNSPSNSKPTAELHRLQSQGNSKVTSTEDTPTIDADIETILNEYVQISLNNSDDCTTKMFLNSSVDNYTNNSGLLQQQQSDGGGLNSSIDSSNTSTCQYIADNSDFIYAYATIDEYEALRDCTQGSWFITVLVKVITKHAHTTDFLSILTKVNNRLSSNDYIHKGRKQIASVTHSLTKKLYFSVNSTAQKADSSLSSSLVSVKITSLSSLASTESLMVISCSPLPRSKEGSCLIATPPSSSSRSPLHAKSVQRPVTWHTSTPSPSQGSPVFKRQTVSFTNTPSPLQRTFAESHGTSTHPVLNVPLVGTRLKRLSSPLSLSGESQSPYSSSPSSSRRHLLFHLEGEKENQVESYVAQGYCVIINNNGSSELYLTELTEVFGHQLGFHIQVYSDLTRKAIHQLLTGVASTDHTDLHCLIIIVLGQGKSKSLKLENMVTPFSKHRSHKSLVYKPKIFFIETEMNEKTFTEFRDDPFVPTIPTSFIVLANSTTSHIVDTQMTFVQYFLRNVSTSESSSKGFIFQDVIKSTHKVFNMRETGFHIEILDELEKQLYLFKSLNTTTDEQKEDQQSTQDISQVNEKSQQMVSNLKLALQLLVSIRNMTISVLSDKQKEIMNVCKFSQVSNATSSRLQDIASARSSIATALSLRASLVLTETFGITGSTRQVRDKLISKAKLKRAQAVIDVDRQLMEQINKLIKDTADTTPFLQELGIKYLELPLDVNELVSNSIRLYKRSDNEANKWYGEQLDSLLAQREVVEQVIERLSL